MSMTYTTPENSAGCVEADGEVFVPSFARTRRNSKKPVKTWMILAPIGAVVVLGAVGVMLMGGGDEAAAPAAMETETAIAQPLAAQPLNTPATPLETPVQAPAPVVEAAPAAEPAPAPGARRASTPARATPREAPAPVVREETPAEPTGPRAYSASPSASSPTAPSIQTAPLTPAPATPPAPAISVQPLN